MIILHYDESEHPSHFFMPTLHLKCQPCHESTSSSCPEVTDQPPLPNLPRNAWELHRHRNFHNDHVVSTHPRNDNHKTSDVEWWKRVIAALKKDGDWKISEIAGLGLVSFSEETCWWNGRCQKKVNYEHLPSTTTNQLLSQQIHQMLTSVWHLLQAVVPPFM